MTELRISKVQNLIDHVRKGELAPKDALNLALRPAVEKYGAQEVANVLDRTHYCVDRWLFGQINMCRCACEDALIRLAQAFPEAGPAA